MRKLFIARGDFTETSLGIVTLFAVVLIMAIGMGA